MSQLDISDPHLGTFKGFVFSKLISFVLNADHFDPE